MKNNRLHLFAWGLSGLTVILAFVAWANDIDWNFSGLSTYQLFPLLGLTAFSLMWSHYMVASIRLRLNIPADHAKSYFEISSLAVLALILLHPGLLWWQLWRDGLGLPPQSYLTVYAEPAYKFALLLGSISLMLFIAYELRRLYRQRPWWRFVQYGSDAAMLLVLYHAATLGSHLQAGWYRYIWGFYAVSLIMSLVYRYTISKNSR
jgi:hypothetical protein